MDELGFNLDEDRPFQERFWTIQRVAWLVFVAFLVAAMLGFTGAGGPMSRVTRDTNAGAVEYPRVARWQTDDELRIRFPAGTGSGILTLDRDFSDLFTVGRIQPAPIEERATGDGVRLVFALDSSGRETEISATIRPARPTFGQRVHLRLGNGPPVALTAVVLP